MNDVEAAPSLPEGVPTNGLHDDAPQESHPQPDARSSPTLNGDGRKTPDRSAASDDANSAKADSEAETIIQSGREELSPEKRKTFIKHSVDRDDDGEKRDHNGTHDSDGAKARKRKRVDAGPSNDDDELADRAQSRAPSRAISKRPSPAPSGLKREKTDDSGLLPVTHDSPREHSEVASEPPVLSDSKEPSSTPGVNHPGEGAPRGKRYRHRRSESSRNNEPDNQNNNNNTTTTDDNSNNNNGRISYSRHKSKDRSTSPAARSHRRATSSSLLSSGHPQKKKRAPPPLLTDHQRHRSEDRESISSSASGSSLAVLKPSKHGSGDYYASSPVKRAMGNRRDQNGRTKLARACAAHEIDLAKKYLTEQPEELDTPDNAGNTPLQIASLEGCVEIVQALLDAGCDRTTKNIDKDTPLIDAVENGHLEVVKLLLGAGVNPRAGNAEGDQPYDLVPRDSEDYDELRRIIKDAKAKTSSGLPPRKSEDFTGKDQSPFEAPAASPRESTPAIGTRSPPPTAATGRRRTVRSEATRNDLLWTSATPENLRDFAAKGDMAGVATILNVLPKADTESLIAAAKGGHDEVLGLLLGLGSPDPDPEPIDNGHHRPGYNTPMLAAIGRGNVQVINLLLDQPGFNPTRRDHAGNAYYEISQERKGENWEKEYQLLKDAYDGFSKPSKGRKQETTRSPRRPRDKVRDSKGTVGKDSASPEDLLRKRSIKASTSTLSKEGKFDKEKKRRDSTDRPREKSRPKSSRRDSSQGVAEADHPSRRPSRVSHEGKSSEENVAATYGEENIKRRRLIAGRPPPDLAARRSSLISSDSHSGREEAPKIKSEETGNEQKISAPASPLKRRRSSVFADRAEANRRRGRESDPQSKRRRMQSEERISKHSENSKAKSPQPSRKAISSGLASDRFSRDEGVRSRHVSVDHVAGGSVDSERKPEGVPAADRERRQSDSAAMPNAATADLVAEAETMVAKEAKEAEEKRLAIEAERERQEREAREAEEAKEAAERAARIARERAEEEERKRKEAEARRIRQAEEEHQKRLEQERIRQAKVRREQEEQEQRRREALPNRLCTAAELIGSNNPRAKSHEWLQRLLPLATATTRQIDAACSPEVEGEFWIPNYQVAPLLATNDLQLSQYLSWEKRTATPTQRDNLWQITRNILTQNDVLNPLLATPADAWARNRETRVKYYAMEHIFWVRLSDFTDLVPHVPHLYGLKIKTLRIHVDPEPSNTPSANSHGPSMLVSGAPNGTHNPNAALVNGTTPSHDNHHPSG